jgi:excisionase family DNA binding protein
METEILSNDQAAAYLKVSPTTLPRWRWAGTGPNFLRLGRSVRYRKSDLDLFLAESLVEVGRSA